MSNVHVQLDRRLEMRMARIHGAHWKLVLIYVSSLCSTYILIESISNERPDFSAALLATRPRDTCEFVLPVRAPNTKHSATDNASTSCTVVSACSIRLIQLIIQCDEPVYE